MVNRIPSYIVDEIQMIQAQVKSIEDRDTRGKDISASRPELPRLAGEIEHVVEKCFSYFGAEEYLNLLLDLSEKVKKLQLKEMSLVDQLADRVNLITIGNPLLSFSSMPEEMILKIFSFLPPQSLCQVASSSTSMNELANDPLLWKNLCQQNHFQPAQSIENWKEVYKEHAEYFSKAELSSLKGRFQNSFKTANESFTLSWNDKCTILDIKKLVCEKLKLKKIQINQIRLLIGGQQAQNERLFESYKPRYIPIIQVVITKPSA